MSHRRDQKTAARAAREAAEREDAARAARSKRLVRLGAALAVLALAAVLLVVLAGGGDDGGGGGGSAAGVQGAGATSQLLDGIPQDGAALGSPDAPLVMTEFADLQCPFCRDYAVNVLPRIIDEYVRPGKLRLELRLLRFIGPDSDRGARAAVVASRSDRMWNFIDVWYRNQGPEGSGYADDAFIRSVAKAAGVSPQAALDGLGAAGTEAPIVAAEQQANAAGIESTPSFLLNRRGRPPQPMAIRQLTFEDFQRVLDARLPQ